MNYFIGTDIGTSGTKTIITDEMGHVVSSDAIETDILMPSPNWAEQWPEVWENAVYKTIQRAVDKAKLAPEDIKAIAISGLYGGSGIPVDDKMTPVRPCIIWMDGRARAQCDWVRQNIDLAKLQTITHNGVQPYYGYTKMMWIKDNEPENYQRIEKFLPPNSYVIYKLTGEVAIDYSSAGNIGGVFDMEKRDWSKELISQLGLKLSHFPSRIVESTDVVGYLTSDMAKTLGLKENIPVIASGIDCGAANIGLGIFDSDTYTAAIGTSMCVSFVSGNNRSNCEGLIVWPYLYNAKELTYHFAGSQTAGAIVKWFRDTFCELELADEQNGLENAYAALDKKAKDIAIGSEGLIVLPYFMGERSPIWDESAKGTIVGLTLAHTKAHIYRAFLEAVAYALKNALDAMGEYDKEYIIIAGGVIKSQLWVQIFADVTGYSVICPKMDVEANMGDAMLAAIGSGLMSYETVKAWNILAKPVHPNVDNSKKYNEFYTVYQSIYNHLKADMKVLDRLSKK